MKGLKPNIFWYLFPAFCSVIDGMGTSATVRKWVESNRINFVFIQILKRKSAEEFVYIDLEGNQTTERSCLLIIHYLWYIFTWISLFQVSCLEALEFDKLSSRLFKLIPRTRVFLPSLFFPLKSQQSKKVNVFVRDGEVYFSFLNKNTIGLFGLNVSNMNQEIETMWCEMMISNNGF